MSNPVVSWVGDHPVQAGAAAIGVVLLVMLMSNSGGSGQGENTGAVSAYYGAVAAQSQSGNAVQMTQIMANAETNKALIAATYGLETNKVWAGTSEVTARLNADTTIEQARQSASTSIEVARQQSFRDIELARQGVYQTLTLAGKNGVAGQT